jgi:hypothetical protein
VAAASGLLLSGAGTAAAASQASVGTVDAAHPVVTWSGGGFSGLLSPPLPVPCVYNCEQRAFAINLPASSWTARDSGVLVAIHYASTANALNLYVYDPAGNLAGRSIGVDTNGQGVFLAHPANGLYQLVVTETYAQDASVSYVGEARYQATLLAPCAQKACDMLPRLSPAPPSHFHLDGVPPILSTEAGTFFPYTGPGSCYLDEQASGAQRCLRFSQDIRNVGAGPLELRFRFVGADAGVPSSALTTCQMEQVVYRTDATSWTRPAGPCVYHMPHQHFHYQNMALNTLHRVLPTGARDASIVRTSKKLGFCLEDVDNFAYGTPVNTAPDYTVPNNVRCQPTGTPSLTAPQQGVWETMGISRGWGDVYTWDLPSQFIEVTGVADGLYDVVNQANPDQGILESAAGSQEASARICIQGSVVRELPANAADCSGRPAAGAITPSGMVEAASASGVPSLPDTATAGGPRPWTGLLGLPAALGVAVGFRRRRLRSR